MKALCKSEYQDLYRIKDGVLLVVNKFEYMTFEHEKYPSVSERNKKIYKRYKDGSQKGLKVLTADYINDYRKYVIPKGTVLYHLRPVKLTTRDKWVYQIKTTGESFSGNCTETLELLSMIEDIVEMEV